eukprot:830102_1
MRCDILESVVVVIIAWLNFGAFYSSYSEIVRQCTSLDTFVSKGMGNPSCTFFSAREMNKYVIPPLDLYVSSPCDNATALQSLDYILTFKITNSVPTLVDE